MFALAPLWTPHFETELEIISGHQQAGDRVDVATCKRGMRSCLANPDGRLYACVSCIATAARGLDLVGLPPERRHVLPISELDDLTSHWHTSIDELKSFEVDGVGLGVGAASSLVSRVRDSDPDMQGLSRIAEDLLASSAGVYRSARGLLDELKPDLVYIFNGRFASTLPVVRACESAGVRFLTHEAGYDLGTYRLIDGSTIHSLDTVKSAVESTWAESDLSLDERVQIGSEFFTGRRSGGEGDALPEYRFSRDQVSGLVPPQHSGWTGRRIVIFNSSEDEFSAITSYANPVYRDQLDALDALAGHNWPEDTRLTVRMHPNLRGVHNRQTQRALALDRLPRVDVIPPESRVDSYSLLDTADVVVTFGSTIGAEAVFWGRPSVLLGRAGYEDLGVIRPPSHDAAVSALLRHHNPPARDAIIRYGFFQRRWSLPFEHYQQDTMRTGTFRGARVRPALPAKLLSILMHLGLGVVDRPTRAALIERLRRIPS